jgi:hypothetical protein
MGAKLFVPLILQIMCDNIVVFYSIFTFWKVSSLLRILDFQREKRGFGGEFEIGTEDHFKDNSIMWHLITNFFATRNPIPLLDKCKF